MWTCNEDDNVSLLHYGNGFKELCPNVSFFWKNIITSSDTTAGGSGSVDSDSSVKFLKQRSWQRKRFRDKQVAAEAEAICQTLPGGKQKLLASS